MANGDVSVKILYKNHLGGGRSLTGVSKNSKTLVVGEIKGTYVSTGLAVNKHGGVNGLGVSTLDVLLLDPRVISSATDPSAETLFLANYDASGDKIFMVEDSGQANPAVPSDGDAVTVRFFAIGDDANTPEFN